MDGEAVALAIAHALDVLPGHQHAPAEGTLEPGDHLEQRGLAGAVGPHHADDLGRVEDAVDVEPEGRRAIEQAAAVDLGDASRASSGAVAHATPPSSCRLRPGSAASAAASPDHATWPCESTIDAVGDAERHVGVLLDHDGRRCLRP